MVRTVKASAQMIKVIMSIPMHRRVEAARFAEKKLNEFYVKCRADYNEAAAVDMAHEAATVETAYRYGVKI